MTGYYTEMKNPKNAKKTMEELKDLVLKNLAKNPIYYTENGQFGVDGLGYEKELPGLGTPKEPKGKHKASGYGDLKENKISDQDIATKYNEMMGKNPSTTFQDVANKLGIPLSDVESALRSSSTTSMFGETHDCKEIHPGQSHKEWKGSIEEAKFRSIVKEIINGELNEMTKKPLNESAVKRLKEIEEEVQADILELKADKIQQEIEMRENRLYKLEEDEEMTKLLDKKKLKELKKEIKLLEKAGNKVNRLLEKKRKKTPKKEEEPEVIDEDVIDEANINEAPPSEDLEKGVDLAQEIVDLLKQASETTLEEELEEE
jgi:hypothetical protein